MNGFLSTHHKVVIGDSRDMCDLENDSIDLVVTSPPYPMIVMWDGLFSSNNAEIGDALKNDGMRAFELMHRELDKTWNEVYRVVKDGSFVCINVGDATRTIGGRFGIYPNHSRIIQKMMSLGFDVLPEIIWHKPTNSPNKFMGSGMLPAGAYVTLEHEFVLVFRKGHKREFLSKENRDLRRCSSLFWEERNEWFTDIWDFKGVRQSMKKENTRERSAAYPCELPRRLISMFSCYGDTVLDPFIGTGTTIKASVLLGRNSVGYELNRDVISSLGSDIVDRIESYKRYPFDRLNRHMGFVRERIGMGMHIQHYNRNYGVPVMTEQEEDIVMYQVNKIDFNDCSIDVDYVKFKSDMGGETDE